MKYSLGDYIKTIVIGLLVFSFLLIIFVILKFDYNLGVNCCNKNNIPLDFVLPVSGISRKWNAKMLDTILQNQTYIGSLVQCKRTRISHKTHNIVRVPEDEWVISNEKHNAIINEKNFNQVQDILYNRNVRVNKEGKFYKYTG